MSLAWRFDEEGPGQRLLYFPPQGEKVRMVEAPRPVFEEMVGWEFMVLRNSWRKLMVRLRAEYNYTQGVVLEVLMDSTDAGYFEPC